MRPPIHLPARLAAVAALVPPGRPMADIGTDHGRLPAFLVASGRVPRAVGIDDKEGPLAVARALQAALGLGAALEYRLASGCEGLADIDTITVAGMGGPLIARIVAGAPGPRKTGARAAGASTVVLQPNAGERELRAWLCTHGWRIAVERLVWDRGRRFVVMMATHGVAEELDIVDLTYGAAGAHQDLDALLARLDADELRLRDLVERHGDNPALAEQRELVRRARGRLP